MNEKIFLLIRTDVENRKQREKEIKVLEKSITGIFSSDELLQKAAAESKDSETVYWACIEFKIDKYIKGEK